MDEADFLEDMAYKQQEDLPYDEDLSQTKMCTSYNFTLTNDTFPVSVEVVQAGEDPQEMAVHCSLCQNTALPETWDKMTEQVVSIRQDKDKQCAVASPAPANKEDTSKSHISDIVLHHLFREQFVRGQGTAYETLPETSNTESLDDAAILTDIISCFANNYCPKEQTPEVTGQHSPQNGAANSNKPCCPPDTAGENTSLSERPVAAGLRNHQEDLSFLMRTKGPGDKHKTCLGQTPQRQLVDNTSADNLFKYSQARVHDQLPDFSKVDPKGKIPRNTVTNKPLTIANQGSFSPRLRNKSTVVQDNLRTMSGSNCVEKQPEPEQKRKLTEPSKQIQVNENLTQGVRPTVGLYLELGCTSEG